MTDPIASPADLAAPAAPEPTFDVLPLGAEVRRALDAMGYRHPTPVQRAVYEPAAEGRSLVVQARTGTGKTAAFGLPVVDRLVRPNVKAVQALVLCPTRELALQVGRELEQLGQFRGIKTVAIYGGASMTKQIEALEAGAQIVIGTPGRVLDHLRQRTLDPSAIRVLVLDESDEMLSMGFARELYAILETLPKNRQGLFFSATLPPDIERLAKSHLRNPELITLSSDQVGALEIGHYVYVLRDGDKIGQLVRIIEVEDPESAIIFSNTRDDTLRVAEALKARGFDADWLNGDLPQNDRERVMNATKQGRLRFLVATDVAARGIDISHLTHVINYDFPDTAEQYVHRTGRTGRAGRTGTAISVVGPKDIGNLYLLRLTYKIRPIEKQLPSAGELKTRAELDLVQLFADAFASRPAHVEDLAIARRLLTHDDAERIVAGLLRDHLGARAADVNTAGEARRARNPPPQAEHAPAPREVAPQTPPRDVGPRDGARDAPVREGPSRDRPARDGSSRDARPREPRGRGSSRETRETSSREPSRRVAVAQQPAQEDPAGREEPWLEAVSYPGWEPPKEADDERPILSVSAPVNVGVVAVGPGASAGAGVPSGSPAVALDSPEPAAPHADAEDGDYVQLFVNVGKREGVRPSDLQKLLSDSGIASDASSGIRIRDRMSFVRVRRELFDRAVAALSGQVIGGRTVAAELARGRG